jgi:hypothetical protein
VSGRSRAESQVGVRLMGVWRVSYSNIQEFSFYYYLLRVRRRPVSAVCLWFFHRCYIYLYLYYLNIILAPFSLFF